MLIRSGFVDKNKIWNFVKRYEFSLEKETWNGKVNTSNRQCIWLGVGVNLGIKSTIFKGLEIDSGLKKRADTLWNGEDWNSILIYKYEPGLELKVHTDREIFDNKVVLINISQDTLFGGDVNFIYDGEDHILSNGEVIEFNCRVPHGIKKLNNERWSISIRKVKI